jgi:small subunit ribosomal protein S3
LANERKFVQENIRRVLLKEYMMEKTKRAGFGGVDIQRTPMGTRITLIVERPGFVIGRKGGAIKDLTDAVSYKFKFDNPQIEVQEVDNPNLNAQIMAEKLASSLERGWHFRRAGHSTVRRIMEAGAKGCQVIIAGKLSGERHRTEKYKEGHIKFCGEPREKWMHEGFAVAKLKPGVIGVTVQIMDPNAVLPDEINVGVQPTEEEKKAMEAQKAKEEQARKEEREKQREARRKERRGGRDRRDRKGGRSDRRSNRSEEKGKAAPEKKEHENKEAKESEKKPETEKEVETSEKKENNVEQAKAPGKSEEKSEEKKVEEKEASDGA